MFRTNDDILKEKMQSDLYNVKIDKSVFGIQNFDSFDKFYDSYSKEIKVNGIGLGQATNEFDSFEMNSIKKQNHAEKNHMAIKTSIYHIGKVIPIKDQSKELTADFVQSLHDFETKYKKRNELKDLKDKLEQHGKQKEQKKKKDIFSWLSVPSRFNLLRKQVRSKVVEMVGENDRYKKIEQALSEYEQAQVRGLGDAKENIEMYNFRVNLMKDDEIKLMMENEIEDICESDPAKLFKRKRDFDNQKEKYKRKRINHSDFIGMDSSYNDNKQNTGHENGLAYANFNPRPCEIPENFAWDATKESEYKKLQHTSKAQLQHTVNTSKWTDCGQSKFIQSILNDDQVKNLREVLLDKYVDGQFLTAHEIRYLAQTSETLNRFLDKKKYQQAVDLMERDCIEDIEMMIGNSIINEYMQLKKTIISKRAKYYKDVIKTQQRKLFTGIRSRSVDETGMGTNTNGMIELDKKLLSLYKNQIVKMINQWQKTPEDESKKKEIYQSWYGSDNGDEGELGALNLGIQPGIDDEFQNTKVGDFLMRNVYGNKWHNTNLHGKLDHKQYLHQYHPHSKLILLESDEKNLKKKKLDRKEPDDVTGKGKSLGLTHKRNKEEMEYQIKKNRDYVLLDKKKYQRVYSNGPLERKMKLAKTLEEKDLAARMIQKMVRGHLVRKTALFNRKNFRKQWLMSGKKLDPKSLVIVKTKAKKVVEKKQSADPKKTRIKRFGVVDNSRNIRPSLDLTGVANSHKRDVWDAVQNSYDSDTSGNNSSKSSKLSPRSPRHQSRTKRKKSYALNANDNIKSVFKGEMTMQNGSNRRLAIRSKRALISKNEISFDNSKSPKDEKIVLDSYFYANYGKCNNQSFGVKGMNDNKRRDSFGSECNDNDDVKFSRKNSLESRKSQLTTRRGGILDLVGRKQVHDGKISGFQQSAFSKETNLKVETPIQILSKPKYPPQHTEHRKKILDWCKTNDLHHLKFASPRVIKVDTTIKDKNHNSALYYAIQNNNQDMAKLLLKKGASVNEINSNGNTCMHLAFMYNNSDMIKLLLEYKANCNIKNHDRKIPSQYGTPGLLDDLIEQRKVQADLSKSKEKIPRVCSCEHSGYKKPRPYSGLTARLDTRNMNNVTMDSITEAGTSRIMQESGLFTNEGNFDRNGKVRPYSTRGPGIPCREKFHGGICTKNYIKDN